MSHGLFAFTVGAEPPAMSVSWGPPAGPGDSGYIIFFADLLPDDEGFDDLPAVPVCLHCLLEDGGDQLGRGLDLARIHGQVDWAVTAGEWVVPDDAQRRGEA